MQLLVNVDHVATLRNARGEGVPDPVRAAAVCEEAGAAGIVFHLREDRRHIQDEDVHRLKDTVNGALVFEMAATDEMIRICSRVKPEFCTLVPESRQELTTEGGLRMSRVYDDFHARVVPSLKDAGVTISLFIDPVEEDVKAASGLGVECVELHTGRYANAEPQQRDKELERLAAAAEQAHAQGLQVNAGHGLDFDNIEQLLETVPHLQDISIGHALIGDALFNGLARSVSRMAGIIASRDAASLSGAQPDTTRPGTPKRSERR